LKCVVYAILFNKMTDALLPGLRIFVVTSEYFHWLW